MAKSSGGSGRKSGGFMGRGLSGEERSALRGNLRIAAERGITREQAVSSRNFLADEVRRYGGVIRQARSRGDTYMADSMLRNLRVMQRQLRVATETLRRMR